MKKESIDIEIKNLIDRSKKFIVFTILITLFSSSVIIIVPILVNYYIEYRFAEEYMFIILLLIISVVSFIFQLVLTILREKFSVNFNIKNSIQMYKTMFKMKYDELNNYGPSYLVDRIAIAVNSIYLYICSSLTALISNIVIILAAIITIIFFSPIVSLLLFIIVPINYFGMKLINKNLYKKSVDLQETCGKNYRNIIGLVTNPDFIKQNSYNSDLVEYIEDPLINVFKKTADVNKYGQVSSSIVSSINILIQNIVIVILGISFYGDIIEVNSLILVSMLLPIFFNSLNGFVNSEIEMKDFRASYAFYKEIKSKTELDGEIELKEVINIDVLKNKYEIHEKIVEINENYHFVKGDIVYLSGESGAGKSTILKLFPRFRDSDFIKINGLDTSRYSLETLRNKISYVSQDATILPISLRKNLVFGVDIKSEEELKKIIDSEILKPIFKNKELETLINEKGSNLSGGEKQRIVIARELLKTRDVIIFDESTNSIDNNYSNLIFNNIISKFHEKIVIIVSHNEIIRSYCNKEMKLSIQEKEI